ncbi:histone-fold-containing protein [Tricharina praecox]|uniref:histone-fold-containing protein n=1 Tax=Tricharina praecox TaxID=43433 RepID=UPI00221F5BD4|nr:histone-fold-containing protein [Tricharina praecox]KAI5848268.1 histone-fold-containing protein [Tricharina praecox]
MSQYKRPTGGTMFSRDRPASGSAGGGSGPTSSSAASSSTGAGAITSAGGKVFGKDMGRGFKRGPVLKRRRKLMKDTIHGITKSDIRRLARRGGVKRLSAEIYDEGRIALRDYLTKVLRDCVIYCEHSNRKTVTVFDVIHSLQRIGKPVYGFGA